MPDAEERRPERSPERSPGAGPPDTRRLVPSFDTIVGENRGGSAEVAMGVIRESLCVAEPC